ncbi:MAG: 16S rRNA (adenine(1518)-N(6)/adenine(1519)-N(6))-dimethyltransferase RsmA [Candidatus Thorarchaeota archaeon]|jgi:16S rRNA (adenine1518-N6/adenine1519-N6)-dimethyltransferase
MSKTQVSSLSDDIRRLLNKYEIKPKKKHGQSFLTSHSIARDIVSLAELSDQDEVLEIGGGLGVLTRLIAEEAQHVHVIEIDPRVVKALRDALKDFTNVNIIEGDALTVDLPRVNKIIANLPYSISSEITFRILREMEFEDAILMYQKEFASRLVAGSGTTEYSRLTINVQYYAEVEEILEVPANMFYPVPAVDSTVVRMTPRIEGLFARDEAVFHWMIRGIYPYPNKNLRKALRIWFRNLRIDKNLSDKVISRLEGILVGNERLRSINLNQLVRLADVLLVLIEEGTIADPRV